MLWRAAMAVKTAALGEEFVEAALLDDAAFFEDEDVVHGAEGGEAVGDADDGAVFGEAVDGFLDFGLGLGIERGGGFVEDEDGRVADKGAGDGDALALAAGEALAAFAERRVVALREVLDEVVRVGFLAAAMISSRVAPILPKAMFSRDGGVEEKDVLADEREVEAEVGDAELFERDAVDLDAGRRWDRRSGRGG